MSKKRVLTPAQKAAKAERAKRRRRAKGVQPRKKDKYGMTPAERKKFRASVKRSNAAVKKAGVVGKQVDRDAKRQGIKLDHHERADEIMFRTGFRDESGRKTRSSVLDRKQRRMKSAVKKSTGSKHANKSKAAKKVKKGMKRSRPVLRGNSSRFAAKSGLGPKPKRTRAIRHSIRARKKR